MDPTAANRRPTLPSSSGEEHPSTNPEHSKPPREHFNTSNLYSIEIINALLARQPLEAKEARKPLLAAKVYLDSSKIDKDSPTDAVLELCGARLELVSCHLHDKEIIPAESEALQVLATCKKITKSTRTRHRSDAPSESTSLSDGETATRCMRTQIRALELLYEIDEERGISARAARWREMRGRLEERLRSMGT